MSPQVQAFDKLLISTCHTRARWLRGSKKTKKLNKLKNMYIDINHQNTKNCYHQWWQCHTMVQWWQQKHMGKQCMNRWEIPLNKGPQQPHDYWKYNRMPKKLYKCKQTARTLTVHLQKVTDQICSQLLTLLNSIYLYSISIWQALSIEKCLHFLNGTCTYYGWNNLNWGMHSGRLQLLVKQTS